jgi:hypothetical protein
MATALFFFCLLIDSYRAICFVGTPVVVCTYVWLQLHLPTFGFIFICLRWLHRQRRCKHAWRMLTYADECWRMLTYADECWRFFRDGAGSMLHGQVVQALPYADVCWRMLTYADVCWRMLTYARDGAGSMLHGQVVQALQGYGALVWGPQVVKLVAASCM